MNSFTEAAKASLEKFLEGFPDNATRWGEATDEPMDILGWLREENGTIPGPVGWPTDNPGKRNLALKEAIWEEFGKLSDESVRQFSKRFRELLKMELPGEVLAVEAISKDARKLCEEILQRGQGLTEKQRENVKAAMRLLESV